MATKQKLTTQQILSSIKVNISAYLRKFSYHADLSEQHTKKGPGRKHKQGKQKYIPAEVES